MSRLEPEGVMAQDPVAGASMDVSSPGGDSVANAVVSEPTETVHVVIERKGVDPNFFVDLGWDPVWRNLRKLGALWVLISYPYVASYVPVVGDSVAELARSYQSLLKVWFVQSVFAFVFAADDTLRLGWTIGLSWISCFRWMLQTLMLNDKALLVLRGYAKHHGIKLKRSDDDDNGDNSDGDEGDSSDPSEETEVSDADATKDRQQSRVSDGDAGVTGEEGNSDSLVSDETIPASGNIGESRDAPERRVDRHNWQTATEEQ